MASSDNGCNYLKWDCEKDGCFNEKKRLKFHVFATCFPGKINFSDVDGIVEINGMALMLEWKDKCSKNIPKGQEIMYKNITKNKLITVFIVLGDAEFMTCERYCMFFGGKQGAWINADLEQIKARIKQWSKWAKAGDLIQYPQRPKGQKLWQNGY